MFFWRYIILLRDTKENFQKLIGIFKKILAFDW